MTQTILQPTVPLNFVIKNELLKHLSRTDIYIIEDTDTKNGDLIRIIRDFHDQDLIIYIHNKQKHLYTIKYMGEIVAKMDWRPQTMAKTRQNEDILQVVAEIESKATYLKKVREALDKMSEQENRAFQLGKRALENARYE